MAMKNPPRRTTIRGQKHLLAYITPDEAKLLKAMGGSGEKVNGIPAYPGGFGGEGMGGFGGMSGGGESASGDVDAGWGGGDASDRAAERAAAQAAVERAAAQAAAARAISQAEAAAQAAPQMGMSPGAMGGAIGSAYQTAPSIGTGFNPYSEKARSIVAASGPSSKLTYDDVGNLVMAIKNIQDRRIKAKQLGAPIEFELFGRKFGVPSLGGLAGSFLSNRYLDILESNLLGGGVQDFTVDPVTGRLKEVFTKDPFGFTVRTGDDLMPKFDDGKGPETVAATYNPVTGEQQCPDGYVFDEDLQACRMSADLPSFGTPAPSTGPYEAGDYVRMGLLDVAPMGMSLFADRYGIPQTDFGAANLAFRRGSATRPQYFKQAPDLPGFTLLS